MPFRKDTKGFPGQGLSYSFISGGNVPQKSSVFKWSSSEYQTIWYVTFFHNRILRLMGTSHFRVTAAVPGSSVTYVTVGFPRKSSSKGVGGSREVNKMKNYF